MNHQNSETDIIPVMDASDSHISAVLQQKMTVGWRPVSFLNKKLLATVPHYLAIVRELWAVFSGIRYF
jgi:hypothetical protein